MMCVCVCVCVLDGFVGKSLKHCRPQGKGEGAN